VIVLEILHGTASQRLHRILVNGGTATIGRSPQGTVVLSDFHLSGDHAQITQVGDHYVFRDLRSTNGSAVERDGRRITVDAAARWEVTLAHGDILLLGNPAAPVRIAVRIGDESAKHAEDLGDRLIASRSIMDLPAVAGQIEGGDPADALRIYKSLQPLGARLEPSAAIEAVVEATFQLLARATHVAVLLRSETDRDRFALAMSRERPGGSHDARPANALEAPAVRASRAVLRRVLADRAAVLTANALEALSSESIMSGSILSILAVPLWRGEDIIGLIQADNRA
jgi:Nif-specific regulatory protein